MKISRIPNFSRNRKIHNPFKRRNSSSKSASHSHSVHQQNVISALGGIPHDFDYDFQSDTTETPTAYSSRRSSIYSISSTDLRIDPDYYVYSYYQTSHSPNNNVHPLTATTEIHNHHHHNNQCCHNLNCKQNKKQKRNSFESYNPKRSFTGFKLWLRLTWVKVGRTFR